MLLQIFNYEIKIKLLKILGMNQRSKTKSGKYRKKRSDTIMKSIEKKYGKDFGVRSDKKLGNYLKEKGYESLSKMLGNE